MSRVFEDIYARARQDRERYLCALTAPRTAQPGLMALLAFNQDIASIATTVSEPMLGTLKLQWWVDVMPGVVRGRPPSHPVAQALSQMIGGDDRWLDRLRALIEARNFDLDQNRPQTLDDLKAYAQVSGGDLHRALLYTLGLDDGPSHRAAHDIGTAWALIGLMRALPYQSGVLRDMLPQTATVKDVLEDAAQLLARARRESTVKAALPSVLAGRLADRHLKRLEAQNWDPAARPDPPAGLGAVASVWLGKWTGNY